LPLGDEFAWAYFRLVNNVVAVTWTEFQTWRLWMVGAALGMDRIEASEDDQAAASAFFEASSRAPSLDRKG